MRNNRLLEARRNLFAHLSDPLYRNSYFLTANTILISGSGFLFWLVASHVASPERIGLATASIGALTLLALFARLGFDVSLLRYLPSRSGARSADLLDTALSATTLVALVLGLGFAIGTPLWSPGLSVIHDRPAYVIGFGVLTAVWTLGLMFDSVFTARRDTKHVLFKNGVHTVLKLGLVLVLPALMGEALAAAGIVLSWVGSMVVAILVAALVWLPVAEPGYRPRPRIARNVLRETLSASFANYAVSLVLAIPLSIGSLVVLERHGAADAGSFYILWMFGSLALAIPSAFGQSFLVEMMHRAEEGLKMAIPKRGLAIAGVAGLLTVIAGEIALPLFGAHYRALQGWPLVPFGLSAIPGYLLYARMAQFRATHQNLALVVPPVLAVAIFLGSLWLPWESVVLTGWTWLVALTVGASAAFVERVRPARVEPRSA